MSSLLKLKKFIIIPFLLDVNLSSTIVRILFNLFCFLANLAWYAAIFSNSLLALSSAVSFLGSFLAFFFVSSTIFEGSLLDFFFSFLFDCFSVNDSLSRNNISYFKNLYIKFYRTMILNKKWKY